tara:strand:- start:953 stop:2110 length:1158 start_codon:yes stop_codon:yes gene_type:complete
MTTRNFRVHNGISVGDIVIDASANTITGGATAAPSSDGQFSNKKYVDDSIAAISSTAITQGNSNVTVTDSGTGKIEVTADGTEVADFAVAATTITATGNINLTAGADVAIPNNIGVLYGTGGEKIESDGTDLTVTSTGALNLTVTGLTTVSGALTVSGDFTVNGTTTTNNSVNLTVDDNIIELNSGISTSNNDAGIIIERGSTGNNACILWDESADKFTMGTTTATAGDKSGGITVAVGTLVSNLEGTATAAEYSDVAERFASDTAYEAGTVVALGGAAEITQVNEEGSDEVFGVISSMDQAAFKMNGAAGNDDTHPYIAMTGRVNVKVIGSVNKGDRLISASVPGYAKAATKAECTAFNVIGRALTGKTEAGQGSVLAAVRVSH